MNIIISHVFKKNSSMTRMFRTLNELKSEIIVVDKLLETSSIANYSKSTQRIKNAACNLLLLLLLLLLLYNSTGSLPVQSVTCQSNKFNSTVTITANKMDAKTNTIDSKSTGREGYASIDVSHIIQCIQGYHTRALNSGDSGA